MLEMLLVDTKESDGDVLCLLLPFAEGVFGVLLPLFLEDMVFFDFVCAVIFRDFKVTV